MIRLEYGSNNVVLTLSESTNIATPTYLFEFESNNSHVKYYCIANDVSSYPDRYNKFSIFVTSASPVALNGELKLPLGDEYNYTIYAQSSTTNLDPTLADEIVETGYMTYDKVMIDRAEYTPSSTTRNVYEKS